MEKEETRWLRGAHTFGTSDVRPKQSGRIQGRAADLKGRASDRLVRLIEKGEQGDPLTAKPRPIYRKGLNHLKYQHDFASKDDKQKIAIVKRRIAKLQREFEELKKAPQRRRTLNAPVILRQIDEEQKKLIVLVSDINKRENDKHTIFEIRTGDLSEFKKEKKVKAKEKKKEDYSVEEYSKLIEEQSKKYEV